jgi:anti-sigma-K factor RskA
MSEHAIYDELVAAYALEALDAAEVPAFERHLADCAACQATLADLRRVAAGLGMAAPPLDPPASLRVRTLARATSQPQSQPVRPAPAVTPAVPPARSDPSWSWLATAAALVLAAGLGVYALRLRQDLTTTRQLVADMSQRMDQIRADLMTARGESARLATTIAVLAAADVVRVDLTGSGAASAATARAYLSARGLVLSGSSLPPLAASRTYQVWVIPTGPGALPISAGLMGVDAGGTATLTASTPAEIARIAAVAISEEPSGGSPQPTSQPLLVGARANN